MNEFILKYRPDDFLVREVLVSKLAARGSGPFQYAILAKTGFTTMEAVRLVAARFGLASSLVTYAGLKDEDGVTEQLLALPHGHLDPAGWHHRDELGRTLRLQAYGFGDEPLSIGGLEGNAFRLVVRNLHTEQARRLSDFGKLNHLFVNYYDIQRFGVPGGPRRTHLLGAAILRGRWDEALTELAGLGAPESPAAVAWDGAAEQFFLELDSRTTAFYLAAAASWEWNGRLRELVAELGQDDEFVEVEVEGLTYCYPASAHLATRVLAAEADLRYRRYAFANGQISFRESTRPTVIQTQLAAADLADDEYHAGRSRLELRFFLPSGCYATAAIRQLLTRTDLMAQNSLRARV